MNDPLSFALTADGSKTLFNSRVGEHYHSRHGALQESRHVFLESGLKYFLKHAIQQVSILEVGFGTGLNFLVSAEYCTVKKIELEYTGIEAFPLNIDHLHQTGYKQYVPADIWKAYTNNYLSAFKQVTQLNAFCKLQIAAKTLREFKSPEQFDLLYFDAFAAIHQPEMWSEEALSHITKFLRPGGVFVTYAITGNLKRTMKRLGFSIEKVSGAAGKREMLRACKL